MKINLSTVGTLFGTELRMLLRDRRTVIVSLVLPLVVMPLMLFSSSWTTERREHKLRQMVYRYAVTGSQADALRAILAAARQHLASDSQAKGTNRFRFEAAPEEDAVTALNKGKIQLVLEGLTVEEVRKEARNWEQGNKTSPTGSRATTKSKGNDKDSESDWRDALVPGAPVVRIVYRADRDDSSAAMRRMSAALRDTRRAEQAELLKTHGFALSPSAVAAIDDVNVASKGQVAGLALGRIITLFLTLFILAGGAVVATDSLVGEKERGTLETLLTTGATRLEIVAAKHLLVLTVALVITLIQAANLLVYVGFKWIPVRENFAAAVSPAVGALLFVLFLPLAALAASVLLIASGHAKSYKEAQLYFYPISLVALVPTLAPFVPTLPLRSAIVLVPVANIALAAKEILIGSFDWPMIAVSWLVTAAAAAWATRLSVRTLSAEKLITAAETDAVEYTGGPALFGRHVLRWYALLWGVLLIVSNYTAAADIRVQLAINLLVLFFGASMWMIHHYRLNPRAALALRMPRPAVWLAVLFAVPGGLITGIGLFRLANVFIPVPAKMIESFSRSVVPNNVPFWQLIFFLAVLPGIFEEITFRGVLLHGLHRRLHPATLALVVGLVFGLFHVALFRLAPTIFLGILLAAVTLLTGSIFPAMLWHALNNAIGILPVTDHLGLEELNPAAYLAGAGILAAAFWIIWRNRTPYPGLRPWHKPRGPKD